MYLDPIEITVSNPVLSAYPSSTNAFLFSILIAYSELRKTIVSPARAKYPRLILFPFNPSTYIIFESLNLPFCKV